MENDDLILVFSADNAYNTRLHSPSSPDPPLYTITSDPGIDPGSTSFTLITNGLGGSEVARWIWRARWRGDLLTYANGKAVKTHTWTKEHGFQWKMNDESEALELFRGKDVAPLARFERSSSATAEPAKLHLSGSVCNDSNLQDAIAMAFFQQERARREKGWAAPSGKTRLPMKDYVAHVVAVCP